MPGMLGIGLGIASASGGSVNIIPGDNPQNGMSGADFFLDGSQVAPTSFFSSAYDAQYHTANGIEVPDGVSYSPQLAAEIVALFEQPYTVVLDGTINSPDSGISRVMVMTDNTVFFEVDIQVGFAGYNDGSDSVGQTIAAPGRYRFAWTHDENGVLLSINGGAVMPYTTGDPLGDITGAVILGVREDSVCHEFTIYTTPVTDEAALQALSGPG